MSEMSNVFQFMELRAPFSPEEKSLRQNYIVDNLIVSNGEASARIDADLQSTTIPPSIGSLVYESVFCRNGDHFPEEMITELLNELLKLLPKYQPLCPEPVPTEPVVEPLSITYPAPFVEPLLITELERRAHIKVAGEQINDPDLYYLLPERLEHITDTLFDC
jgi:hypothetical protein